MSDPAEIMGAHIHIRLGPEEALICVFLVGLIIFLLSQIYRCAVVVLDPYAAMDKDTWTDNLEKGTLQSFM
ncbi:cortexin-3-like [Ciona intestinalis]